MKVVILVVGLVFAGFFVLALARFAWLLFVRNEQMDAGGSMGTQVFGRRKR